MDFITPYYTKKHNIKRQTLGAMQRQYGSSWYWYVCCIVVMGVIIAFAALHIPTKEHSQLHSLYFPVQLQEALNNGVTLHIDCNLIEETTFATLPFQQSKKISAFVLRHHPLSNQYIVKVHQSDIPHIFHSIRGASNFITHQSIQLLEKRAQPNKQYKIELQLNKYKLPSPLRLQAFLSQQWSLNNNWITWESNK